MKKIYLFATLLLFAWQSYAQKESNRVLTWTIGQPELIRGEEVLAKFPLRVAISDPADNPQLGTSTIRLFYDAGFLESLSVENVNNGYEVSGFNESRDVYGEVFGFEGEGGVFAQFDAIANQMNPLSLSSASVHVLDFMFKVKPGSKLPLCASIVLDNNPQGWGRGSNKDSGYLVNDSGIVGGYFINGNTEEVHLADDEVENFLWEKSAKFDYLVDRLNDKVGAMTLQKSRSCLTTNPNILPVELMEFEATKINEKKVLLDWITVSEFNNEFFEVQRSADGEQFESLGQVKGQWNTIDSTEYAFIDDKIESKQYYYRLSFINKSGQEEYSSVRLIHFENKLAAEALDISFYPNPTKGITYVSSNKIFTDSELLVFDMQGRLVLRRRSVGSDSKLDLSVLHGGNYKLFLKGSDGQSIALQNLVIIE